MVAALVVLAACSTTPAATLFEDGTEFEREAVLADRSTLPGCEGEGFCSNAWITACVDDDGEINSCLETPNGERSSVLGSFIVAPTVSPSGRWLLVPGAEDWELVATDGHRVALPGFSEMTWLMDDTLIAIAEDGIARILDVEGREIDRIAPPPGIDVRFIGADFTADGQRLVTTGSRSDDDGFGEREIWVFDRRSDQWQSVDDGEGFINLASQVGFGPDETSVIAQLGDERMLTEFPDSFDYRLVAIEIDSGEVTLIEASTGFDGQFFSVSPDGRMAAITGLHLVRVVDTTTGLASDSVHRGPNNGTGGPDWSSDGQFITFHGPYVARVRSSTDDRTPPSIERMVDATPVHSSYVIGVELSGVS